MRYIKSRPFCTLRKVSTMQWPDFRARNRSTSKDMNEEIQRCTFSYAYVSENEPLVWDIRRESGIGNAQCFPQSSLQSHDRTLRLHNMGEPAGVKRETARIKAHTISAVMGLLPGRKELIVHSPRTAVVKRCVKEVLEACSKEQKFARFSWFC